MGDTWLTHEELVKEHRKLKADHEDLREIVDLLVKAMGSHIHGLYGEYAFTKEPLKQHAPTPPPTPSPTSAQTREPAAPAEGAR